MAQRRMFAKTIIDSDMFLDMPLSTQCLYFHLSMRADDDGFINNPRKIQKMIGAADDDLKVLITKKFIIPFESGIVVIKHWKIHNYIQKDRYKETVYLNEKALLEIKENNAYKLKEKGMCETISIIEEDDKKSLTSAQEIRYKAKKESDLPYSFEYKIRNAFVGEHCPLCGCLMDYSSNIAKPTIQHNVPISLGGKHEIDNISVICQSCNCSIQNRKITSPLNTEKVKEVWENIGNVSGMDTTYTMYTQDSIELGNSKDSIDIYSPAEAEPDIPYKEICEYLNLRTNSNYRHTTRKTRDLIKARFNEKFTLNDFITVIDKKCAEWMNTEMQKYLRPETLFGTKFESYLNQQIKVKKLTTKDLEGKIDLSDF